MSIEAELFSKTIPEQAPAIDQTNQLFDPDGVIAVLGAEPGMILNQLAQTDDTGRAIIIKRVLSPLPDSDHESDISQDYQRILKLWLDGTTAKDLSLIIYTHRHTAAARFRTLGNIFGEQVLGNPIGRLTLRTALAIKDDSTHNLIKDVINMDPPAIKEQLGTIAKPVKQLEEVRGKTSLGDVDMMDFLKIWMDESCMPRAVAKRAGICRRTVETRIKRVKEYLDDAGQLDNPEFRWAFRLLLFLNEREV